MRAADFSVWVRGHAHLAMALGLIVGAALGFAVANWLSGSDRYWLSERGLVLDRRTGEVFVLTSSRLESRGFPQSKRPEPPVAVRIFAGAAMTAVVIPVLFGALWLIGVLWLKRRSRKGARP